MKKKSIAIIIALFLAVAGVAIGVAATKSSNREAVNGQTLAADGQLLVTEQQEEQPKEETPFPTDSSPIEEAVSKESENKQSASPEVEQSPKLETPSVTPNQTETAEEATKPTKKPQQTPAMAATAAPAEQATEKPTAKPVVTPTENAGDEPVRTPVATKAPVITAAPEKEEEKTESVTLTIDASVIGNGMLLGGKSVEVKPEEKVSHAVARALSSAGFTYSNTGSVDSNFYLSSIKKVNLVKNPTVSDHVMDILEDNGVKLRLSKYSSGSLSEFDFTNFSGWRYSVNGTFPGVGMSEYDIKDGDRIVLKYTLCLGYDA